MSLLLRVLIYLFENRLVSTSLLARYRGETLLGANARNLYDSRSLLRCDSRQEVASSLLLPLSRLEGLKLQRLDVSKFWQRWLTA